jgi:hypothetical protein
MAAGAGGACERGIEKRGVFAVHMFAPVMMRKSPQAEQNAKFLPMVRICGILLLVLGLVRLAGKVLRWGI